jgi:hypothetical protein
MREDPWRPPTAGDGLQVEADGGVTACPLMFCLWCLLPSPL